MKSFFVILLIGGFLSAAVLSILFMGRMAEGDHNGCLAAKAQGVDCPRGTTPFHFLNFHLNAFKTFSTAIFGENILATALMFLVLVSVLGFIKKAAFDASQPLLSRLYNVEHLKEISKIHQRQFIYWLSLHENSPALY